MTGPHSQDPADWFRTLTPEQQRELMRSAGPTWLDPVRHLAAAAPIYVAAPAHEFIEEMENTQVSPRVPLFSLCTLVEALLRFLAGARLAEIAAAATPAGRLPPKLAGALRDAIQVPTFGRWRAMLQQIVHLGGERSVLMPELVSTHSSLETLVGPQAGHTSPLIELRNALAHGGAISNPLARTELEHWGPLCAPMLAASAWLSELHLFAGDLDGTLTLNGARPGRKLSPVVEEIPLGHVVMRRGEHRVSLVPFGRYAPVRDGAQPVVQGFVRRGTTSLVYATLHSDEAMQTEGDEAVLDAFERLFDLAAARAAARVPASGAPIFELDMAREAAGFVGRAAELDRLWDAVIERHEGVLWVEGVPGVGKSALMARLVTDLREEFDDTGRRGGKRQLVLPYRFRSGQAYCHGGTFLAWLIERLSLAAGTPVQVDRGEPPGQLRARAADALSAHGFDRVVVVLDGLDELARDEPLFWAETLPRIAAAARRTLFLCSGRGEAGLPELMRRPELHVRPVFPGGLPGMGEADLRAFLDIRLQTVAARFLRNDLGEGKPRNAFVSAFAARSEGLPIYAELVARDIAQGRLSRLDASDADKLPAGIQEYFAKLVTQASWGDEVVYRGLAGMIVAVALAPVGVEVVADLLRRDSFDAGDRQLEEVRRALANLGGLLRERITADGQRGYEVFHTQLRDFVRNLPKSGVRMKVQTMLASQALHPGAGAAAPYLFRYGVAHLADAGRATKAARLLSDLEYQVDRLACLERSGGDGDLRRDWLRLSREGAAHAEPALSWSRFWATDGGLLERGIARNAARELLERCLEYAPDTEMGAAVDRYVAKWS